MLALIRVEIIDQSLGKQHNFRDFPEQLFLCFFILLIAKKTLWNLILLHVGKSFII